MSQEDNLHHTLSVEVIMVIKGIPSQGEPQPMQGGHQQQVRPKDERKLDIVADHQDLIHLWSRPSTPKESSKETPNPSGVIGKAEYCSSPRENYLLLASRIGNTY